jgi:tetratricopeptide (TPR) repeat protein
MNSTVFRLSVWVVVCGFGLVAAGPAFAQRSGGRASEPTPTPSAEEQSAGSEAAAQDEELSAAMDHLRGWRTDAARELLEGKKATAGGDPQFETAWAWLQAEEGELEDAEQKLASAASKAKTDPAPAFLRGEVLLMQERVDAASDAWGEARDRARSLLDGSSEDPVAQYYLGAALVRLRESAAARDPLQAALESEWNDAAVHYQLGLSYVFEREWDDAIEHLDAAIEADPKLAHAYYYRGLAWHQKGRVDKALNDLDLFVQLAPDAPETETARTILEAGQR